MTHPAFLTASLVCILHLGPTAAAQVFEEAVELSDSIRISEHVTHGDLDGDGIAELIVAPYERRGIQIRQAAAGGRFRFKQNLLEDYGNIPRAFPADLDGDGDLDLVFVRRLSLWDLYALENVDGDFSRSTPVFMVAGRSYFQRVTVADLSGDGRDDVILHNLQDIAVISGGVGPAANEVFLTDHGSIDEVADIDGDGVLDLVYSDQMDRVSITPGIGNGQFGAPLPFPVRTNFLFRSAFFDADGDGDLDAVVASGDGVIDNEAGAYVQSAPFQFSLTGSFTIAQGLEARTASFADVDGDGDKDVVVESDALTSDAQLNIFPRDASGIWSISAPITIPSPTPRIKSFVDLNGDGLEDLFPFHNWKIQEVKVAFNETEAGNLAFGDYRDPSVDLVGVKSYALDDFDLDGDLDFVALTEATWQGPYELELLENEGLGRFAAPASLRAITPPLSPPQSIGWRLESGDFNGDGRADLLMVTTAMGQGSELHVLIGDGTGSFSDPLTVIQIPGDNASVLVGSLFGGGYDDLFVRKVVPGGYEFQVFANLRTTAPRFDTGGQTFFVSDGCKARLFDVDSDARLDLVIWTGSGGVYHRQLANGTFAPSSQLTDLSSASPLAQAYQGLALGDVDEDGDVDAIQLNTQGVAGLAMAVSPGQFGATQLIDVPLTVTEFELLDVDLDGCSEPL